MFQRKTGQTGPSKLLVVAAAVLVAVAAALPAGATGEDGGDSGVQVTERNGVRHFKSSTTERLESNSSYSRQASTENGSGWVVRFENSISSNVGPAEWVRYDYAYTRRLSGSGDYKAHAHAALIEGDSYEGEQVFSAFTHSCATKTKVNRQAKTCRSPNYDTEPGDEWLVISGHTYDDGNDGEIEASIAGELDWVWTASSS